MCVPNPQYGPAKHKEGGKAFCPGADRGSEAVHTAGLPTAGLRREGGP